MQANITGIDNTALGLNALGNLTTGSTNIALGYNAGSNLIAGGSNNIYIANPGVDAESGTIRIGEPVPQTRAFIAGIRGVPTDVNDAVAVLIDSAGQLGTVSSSARFKQDIQKMGAASRKLMQLRPVTFRYKQPNADSLQPIQYGLIAEEVAETFPELAAYGADGQIETVKYHILPSLLLNEVQRQQRELDAQAAEIAALRAQQAEMGELRKMLMSLQRQLGTQVSSAVSGQ